MTTHRAKVLVGCRDRWARTNGPGKRQLILSAAWLVFAPVVMLTDLGTSVRFLSAVTLYTVILGHWATFQAATPTAE